MGCCCLQGQPLPPLPSAAGSKRTQPEYPTQDDEAAAPPSKRIRAEAATLQPFTFDFQQPGQAAAAAELNTAAARHAPYIFSAGTHTLRQGVGPQQTLGQYAGSSQTVGQHAEQDPYAYSRQHGPSTGEPPPPAPTALHNGVPSQTSHTFSQPYSNPFTFSAAPPLGSQPLHNPYAYPSLDPARSGGDQSLPQHWPPPSGSNPGLLSTIPNRESSSAQAPSRIPGYPSSTTLPPPPSHFGFASLPYPSSSYPTGSYPVPPQPEASVPQLASQPPSAYASDTYQPSSIAASAYGAYLPAYPVPYPGMHPPYAAFAAQLAHANIARLAASRPEQAAAPMPYPYAPQYAAFHQQTPSASANLADTSSLTPPPPPLYPFPSPPF